MSIGRRQGMAGAPQPPGKKTGIMTPFSSFFSSCFKNIIEKHCNFKDAML